MEIEAPDSLYGGGVGVSVVIPTYGDAEFLPRAIRSVIKQTHDNLEIIVVDSSGKDWIRKSTTGTEGLLYEYQPPTGPSTARNRGVERASEPIVAFLDADDYWHPEKIERQLEFFENGADVVYCDAYIIEDGSQRRMSTLEVTDRETHYIDFLLEGGVPMVTVAARRACLIDEKFDERLDASEDRHLLVRLFREYTPARVAEPLAYYCRRTDSATSDAEFMYRNERRAVELLLERYPDLKAYRETLIGRAKYGYGKRLIRTGESREARRVLLGALRSGFYEIRVLAALCAALPPVYNRRLLQFMERIEERL